MATDPQSLFSAAKCYACYPRGQQQLMVLALLAAIVTAQGGTAPVNLIPNGAVYDAFGTYTVATTVGKTYRVQLGANDGGCQCGSFSATDQLSHTFVADGTTIQFDDPGNVPGVLVTATLFQL